MPYAEVSVNSPAAQRRTYSYSVPPGLNLQIGQAVRVPFGSRLLDGVVMRVTDLPGIEETKEIDEITGERPVLSSAHVSLAQWMSEYYLCPLFDAIALMLAPGLARPSLTFLSPSEAAADYDSSTLVGEQEQILNRVRAEGRLGLKELERSFGQKKARAAASSLVRRGLLNRSYEAAPPRAGPKLIDHISLERHPLPHEAPKGKKQVAIVDYLAAQEAPSPWPDLRQATSSDRAAVRALVKKGFLTLRRVPVTRDPLAGWSAATSLPLALTPAQAAAVQEIRSALRAQLHDKGPHGINRVPPDHDGPVEHSDQAGPSETTAPTASTSPRVFLLHGVTGSGKTEVYLQALAEAVRAGKRGIVLVPEISLTPQTIARFASRFPGRVAVWHSRLSPGEQFDEWQRIQNGEFDVVIGARSAIFAPQPSLGLIILDEEHEWTYKQQDNAPRYHARDVAFKLAQVTGATVVLGSATPDVTTFSHAKRGQFRLLSLPERVTPVEHAPLPEVEIVDMREELKAGNDGLFSRSLRHAVSTAVSRGEQVILFLNRRGSAAFVQCRRCGFVLKCRRCDMTLTYHLSTDSLVCHECNYHTRVPGSCPRCLSPRFKYLGAGTQKLEEQAAMLFAPARVLRWDSDTARGKDGHQHILARFLAREADILVGTQIITKGLDIPAVTVVGVVNADTALNLPDFRAGERTFQLLSQVAGRAGRGSRGGKVFLQTYTPEHYAIKAAARHDYAGFYEKETSYRRQLSYPPFSQLARLVYSHANEGSCQQEAEQMKKRLELAIMTSGTPGITVIGPAPAFIYRVRGSFRWQIVLRGTQLSRFMADVSIGKGWTVDIDPVGLV